MSSKNFNYAVGSGLIITGIVVVARTYEIAMAGSQTIRAAFLLAYILLIGGGMLLIYVTRSLHKAADNLQQIERSIIEAAEQTPDVGRITITCTQNGMTIECSDMDFHERISALEVAKITLINNRSKNGKENQ